MELNLETIEKGAKDLLNAGLGLFQVAAETAGKIQSNVATGYEELVGRGATDTSELVVSMRSNLDKGIDLYKDAQLKVQETLNLGAQA